MDFFLIVLVIMLTSIAIISPTKSESEPRGSFSYELSDLTERQAAVLANMVTDTLMTAHPPAKTAFYVDRAGKLGKAIEAKLRLQGYAVESNTVDAQLVRYKVAQFNDKLLWLSVALPEIGWAVDRLYTITPVGEFLPQSGVALRNDSDGRFPWEPIDRRPILAPTDCEILDFRAGSLKTNIKRELRQCGYGIGLWRLGREGFIDDWQIQDDYQLTVKNGVQGFLNIIRDQYQIDSEIRPVAGKVDFLYRDNSGS